MARMIYVSCRKRFPVSRSANLADVNRNTTHRAILSVATSKYPIILLFLLSRVRKLYPALFAADREEDVVSSSPPVVVLDVWAVEAIPTAVAAAVGAVEGDATLLMTASPTRLNSEGSRGTRAGGTPA